MKINDTIISIPPYLSTTWNQILSIKMKGSQLSVSLKDGDTINIPDLDEETKDLIFKTHAENIEKRCFEETQTKKSLLENEKKELSVLSEVLLENQGLQGFPLKFGFGTLEGLNPVGGHNPLEANAPKIPDHILDKITMIAKAVAPDELSLFPKDIPNCNCFHCQISRKINQDSTSIESEVIEEEIVKDDELLFNQWNVSLIGDRLYKVSNKLDEKEAYTVFLGSPVGCNCGNENCEHIIQVLRS